MGKSPLIHYEREEKRTIKSEEKEKGLRFESLTPSFSFLDRPHVFFPFFFS